MKEIKWGWSISDEILERTDMDLSEKVLYSIMGRLGALEKPIYPSHKWLAQKMGMSEVGIRGIIKRMKDKGFIKYEGRKWKIALYTITDTKYRSSPIQSITDSPIQSITHNKDIQSKDIQTKGIQQAEPAGLIVRELINLFKDINPTYRRLFNNKTEWGAMVRLLNQFGAEKLSSCIASIPAMSKFPGCPQITTPYQLEKKLGQYIQFYNQQNTKGQKKREVHIIQ